MQPDEEPVIEEPAVKEPAAQESAAEKPVIDKPAIHQPVTHQPASTPHESTIDSTEPDADRCRILIIDDEAGPRESIRLSLEHAYECTTAENGYRGLELFDSFHPDLVILDIRMPGIDGVETLRRLREKDRDVEVILLTAYGSLETAQKAIRHGVFDYLEKPFDLHELRATVSRALEQHQHRRQRNTRYDDMQQMLDRLKHDLANFDRRARVGQLSAGIVHEIKNPLTVILGYTQMLMGHLQQARTENKPASNPLSDESARYLSIIEQETVRCTQIARRLLSYSRAPRDQREPTTLYELVTNTQMLIQPQCSINDVTLTAEPPVESVTVNINIGQMHDVLLNLCMNALEAMAGSGTLSIVGRILRADMLSEEVLSDDMLVESEREMLAAGNGTAFAAIEVRDSGPGITPDVLPRIFEAFYTTKTEFGNTGLGLSMCRENIEAHDGVINVVRTHSGGTTFRILLPTV